MHRNAGIAILATLLAPALAAAAPAPVDLAPYLRRSGFVDAKLSPDGAYLAATVAQADRTVLAVIRRADRKATASFNAGANAHVDDFVWVANDRLLVSLAEKFGALETPQPTGELYAVNVDGSRARLLVGARAAVDEGSGQVAGTRFDARQVAAYLLDTLPDEDRQVLIEAWPLTSIPTPRVERMDVHTGKRVAVAEAPVPRASFTTDPKGRVRFAVGAGGDNVSRLYHRPADGGEWQLINDEAHSGVREFPRGFDAAGDIAWLEVQRADGPNAIVSLDTRSGKRREVVRDPRHDPWRVQYALSRPHVPIGVQFSGASLRSAWFDDAHPDARLLARLEKGFGGLPMGLVSSTADGHYALVASWADRNPGDFFLFDTRASGAERLLSRREWIDPDRQSPSTAHAIAARDGLSLDAIVTRPADAEGPLPMVVLPHGGPFGVFDRLEWNEDVQLLAAAGYAVLQVSFRGSGNRGRSFLLAGAREWGARMQDDVTDATRWAIAQGIADAERVCLVGASYGAYASMMGLAREPDLYRCGVGCVGVYDLAMMAEDRVRRGESAETWMAEWVGEGEALETASATSHAAKIADPVLLVAGGRDRIASPAHTRAMEKALRAAGAKVEAVYVDDEGHGFHAEANRRLWFERLLGFLAAHLGGAPAKG